MSLFAEVWRDRPNSVGNTQFIAHAREDIPALLAALDAERSRADDLELALNNAAVGDRLVIERDEWKRRSSENEFYRDAYNSALKTELPYAHKAADINMKLQERAEAAERHLINITSERDVLSAECDNLRRIIRAYENGIEGDCGSCLYGSISDDEVPCGECSQNDCSDVSKWALDVDIFAKAGEKE